VGRPPKKKLKAVRVRLKDGTYLVFEKATQYRVPTNLYEVWTETGYGRWTEDEVGGFETVLEGGKTFKPPVTPQQPKPAIDNRKCLYDMHLSCENPDCQCACGHKNKS